MGDFFVYGAFFGFLLLIFPVFVTVDGYADIGRPKAWFSVSLYNVRVFGGYGEIRKDGFAFHITKKFAILVRYADLAATRKKLEVMKGFQLWKLHQTIETGGAGNPYGALLGAAFSAAGGAAFSVLRTRHPFLSMKNTILLSNRPGLKATVEIVTVFNQLILIVALVKKCLEALINWIRKRKSTASWKKRQTA